MKGGKYRISHFRAQRRPPRPIHASSVLRGALPNIAIGPRLKEFKLRREWPAIVGAAIAARVAPKSLIKNTLYCVVSSSAWMTELNYQKLLIIEKINKAVGVDTVNEIIFKPGIVKTEKADTPPPEEPPQKCSLTSAFIESAASEIKDEALKTLLKRVMKKYPF